MSETNGANFWRPIALGLFTFILGNGVAFLVFGTHAATREDVAAWSSAQAARDNATDIRLQKVEQAVNFLAGELHMKDQLDDATRGKQ